MLGGELPFQKKKCGQISGLFNMDDKYSDNMNNEWLVEFLNNEK